MGILKINYHMHSQYSIDGEMSIEEACEKHRVRVEGNSIYRPFGYRLPDPNYEFGALNRKYLIDIKNRVRYKDCLKIKTGIELDYNPCIRRGRGYNSHIPFDFVIASIHYPKDGPVSRDYYKNRTKERMHRLYYEETLELVKDFLILMCWVILIY